LVMIVTVVNVGHVVTVGQVLEWSECYSRAK
jgi:hypothetical protein